MGYFFCESYKIIFCPESESVVELFPDICRGIFFAKVCGWRFGDYLLRKNGLISSPLEPLFFETAFIDGMLNTSCDLGFLV